MYHMHVSSALAECLFCVSRRERLGETAHRRITGAHIVDAFLIRAPNRAAAPGRAAESARAGRRRQEAGGAIERER